MRRPLLAALALLAVAAGVVVLVLATRGGGGTPAAAPAAPATGPGTTEPAPPAAPTALTEAPAPSLVARPGTLASARTVAGATAAFTAPASWADGAVVRVTAAHQGTTTGQGPGVVVGQPQTVFELALADSGTAPLVLDGVVVQATYGAQHVQAAPLYDPTTTDFGGTLAPGATATAVYSFSIPADQLRDVVLTVDVDGRHFPAVFSGAVPTS